MPKTMRGVTNVKRGKKIYWYAHIGGKKIYCGEGAKGYEKAVAAKSKETARKYELKHSDLNLDVKKSAFKTLSELLDWYLDQPTVKRFKNYEAKEISAKHLKSYFGDIALKDLTVDHQEDYRLYGRQKGWADGYLNNHISTMSAAYHLAVKRKMLATELLPGEFLKIDSHNPRRVIEADEYKALLKVADPDFKDFMICAYETGMRSREIRRLTRSQIRLDIKHFSGEVLDYITLGIFDVKNKTERVIPISPLLKRIIKRRIKSLSADDPVFTYHGRVYGDSSVKGFMKRTCKKAGVTYGDRPTDVKGNRLGVVFHSFRHTFITRLIRQGYSDEVIRRITGHKDLSAYRNYVHLEAVDLMEVVRNRINLYTNLDKPANSNAL